MTAAITEAKKPGETFVEATSEGKESCQNEAYKLYS